MADVNTISEMETKASEIVTKVSPFGGLFRTLLFLYACYQAYTIRLWAVITYGRVIHEFDPWFNYRATKYFVDNGYNAFANWYDYESWYPIGRPVGTTIYPGMIYTAGYIWHFLQGVGIDVSVMDVCVFVPAAFAVLTTTAVAGITYEMSKSYNAASIAAFLMAVCPAHLMRSIAGCFDNESVAVFAICFTFYCWLRSLRDAASWPVGVLTGIAYVYLVACWGGYIFVLNLMGVHAGFLAISGNFTPKLHHAYSLFYVIGTAGAIQFPVVGLQPIQSMEQLGPMFVFFLLQLMLVLDIAKKKMSAKQYAIFMFNLFAAAGAVGVAALSLAFSAGYIGPLSARVRGLLIPHTKTGNPLVDSVAEHQATNDGAYVQYFHFLCALSPLGFFSLLLKRDEAKYFGILYLLIGGYFSRKMVRLILLLSPIACATSGIAAALVFEKSLETLLLPVSDAAPTQTKGAKGKKGAAKAIDSKWRLFGTSGPIIPLGVRLLVKGVCGVAILFVTSRCIAYFEHAHSLAPHMSEPQIITRGSMRSGETIMLDDFREAYWWLRDNTPEDSRVMAWWDYGYQINGIANRTSIADGNTWNHEHIAMLGRALVSEEEIGYQTIRHMADYVLVWSTRFVGQYGDDLAKMPHLARIAGSVFDDVEPRHYMPLDNQGSLHWRAKQGLLYKLHSYRISDQNIELKYYEEAYTTEHSMVRIYKVKNPDLESKAYAAEHHTYPPGLDPVLAKRKNFKQIGDFNRDRNQKD